MAPPLEQLKDGHYARKQLFSRSWLISWSHRRRFAFGERRACDLGGQCVLDYGCGDGTFLALLAAQSATVREAIGAEIHESLVRDCRARLANRPGFAFLTVSELDQPGWEARFDTIVCMEVLEHVVDWQPVFACWDRLLAPGGQILVSVPVETGLAVLIKEVVRRVAGWRGIGDYPGQAPYTFGQMMRSLFAGARQHMPRKAHPSRGTLPPYYDHKGFNWKVLRAALADRFTLQRTCRTPLPFLPASLNSQVWFHLSKRTPSGGNGARL